MWDRRKLLLALSLFTALYHKVTAEALEMAPGAVVYTYSECHEKAWKFIVSGLLTQELNRSVEFQKAWTVGETCSKLIPGITKEHTTALRAYVAGSAEFKDIVDNAIETFGVNVSTYETLFHFKSLHFLLMDSILLQPKTCKNFYVTTEGDNNIKNGSKVRFRTFMKVFPPSELLEPELDGILFFNITSCFFADLGANICHDENLALISPAEVFIVEGINKIQQDDTMYTDIVLKHAEMKTLNGCEIFSRSTAVISTQWLIMVFVALSLSFFNC